MTAAKSAQSFDEPHGGELGQRALLIQIHRDSPLQPVLPRQQHALHKERADSSLRQTRLGDLQGDESERQESDFGDRASCLGSKRLLQ
jgi:hypothetical protein